MISLQNVSFTYPFAEKPALENLTLEVAPGSVTLVTGVSGCGKTTLVRLVNGLCPKYYTGKLEGSVSVNGIDNTERELPQIASDIGTLFQDPESQFFALNVEDEMAFALEWAGLARSRIADMIARQIEFYKLENIRNSSIHELSEGQKQKLGLATVTMGDVKALILDEPTANLDPEATAELADEIHRLKKAGLAILIVDHRLYWLRDVADQVVVMDHGRAVLQGKFEELTEDVRNRYGLRDIDVEDPRKILKDMSQSQSDNAGILGFKNLTFAYKGKDAIFENASLSINRGISAVIGNNGVGKTTLSRILTGLNKAEAGEFFYQGKVVKQAELLRHVAIVLQNADHQLHMKTVRREVETSLEVAGCRGGADAAQRLLEMFDLQDLSERHPQSLSGGQKQRLVIACAVAKNPDVILLDEPTSGLDGINMKRIARILKELEEKGKAVLIITHDLELMGLCCENAVRLPLRKNTAN